MATRKIKDAADHGTKELIYFKGHAKATFMSDGSTVEDAIKNIKPNIDLSDYVKSEELEGYAKTEDIPSLEGYAKSDDIPSLEGYAKEEDIPSLYGYATQQWVNEQEFAHQDDLLNMSFNDIQDSPITENNDGEVNIVDENGNIALKVNDEGLYVKDVIAGEHILSNKMNHSEFKTINGNSILGSGNITIEGGTGNSNSVEYIVETTDDNIVLDNNKYYKKTNVSSSISITLNIPENNTVFTSFSIEFTTSESGTSVSLPDNIKWLNGELPTFENDFTYQISICNGLGVCAKYA